MRASRVIYNGLDRWLDFLLPEKEHLTPPRPKLLGEIIAYGEAIRREIELEDEVRRLGT